MFHCHLFNDTGHERKRCVLVGSTAPASDVDLQRLGELRAQGLSFVKVAARIGYSPAWVMQNFRRLHEHRSTLAEREQARNARIAEVEALLTQDISYGEIVRTLGTSYNTVMRLLGKG